VKACILQDTAALLGARPGTGLQANAEKTKYTFMPREQNAGQNHNIKTGDKSFKVWRSSNIWEPWLIKLHSRRN